MNRTKKQDLPQKNDVRKIEHILRNVFLEIIREPRYHGDMKYEDILRQFPLDGAPASVELYGEGHINETYCVVTDRGVRYILQKINERLFRDVSALMRNIEAVTEHLARKSEQRGERFRGLEIVRTREGKSFCEGKEEIFCESGDGQDPCEARERQFLGGKYRIYRFIEGASAHQLVTDPRMFFESAVAFGGFQNDLADFDSRRLTEILPDFHDTEKRFRDFEAALKADPLGRAREVRREIDFVLERGQISGRITSLLRTGEIPLRVTHNDTKLNNVMIDDATGKAVAVIDLDTVMPGSSCYDFGDSVRFGCSSAREDEHDLGKVHFLLNLFELYAEGYLSTLKNISKIEREHLAFASILMTYECGMRFLADHLEGDPYFRINRPGQNLDRARTQFRLVEEMERDFDRMNRTILSSKPLTEPPACVNIRSISK